MLSSQLKKDGFKVFFVPEVASMLIKGGARHPGHSRTKEALAQLYAFQRAILSVQLSVDDAYRRMAELGDTPAVIIYDRGLLDVKAYLARPMWLQLLGELGVTEQEVA